jgi:hypothetical protein
VLDQAAGSRGEVALLHMGKVARVRGRCVWQDGDSNPFAEPERSQLGNGDGSRVCSRAVQTRPLRERRRGVHDRRQWACSRHSHGYRKLRPSWDHRSRDKRRGRYLRGWKEYFRLAHTPRIFDNLDRWIRRRLRVLHLKHWGQQSTVYRELRARGMSRDAAMVVAVNCRRWWMNSGRIIHVALPNRYFDQFGVPRLATQPQLPEPPGADPHAGWCGRGP